MTHANPPPTVFPRYIPLACPISEAAIRPFVGQYICVWLKTRERLWFCPVGADPDFTVGYIWRDGLWALSKLSLAMIDSFY